MVKVKVVAVFETELAELGDAAAVSRGFFLGGTILVRVVVGGAVGMDELEKGALDGVWVCENAKERKKRE
jgi:hypothetical protein